MAKDADEILENVVRMVALFDDETLKEVDDLPFLEMAKGLSVKKLPQGGRKEGRDHEGRSTKGEHEDIKERGVGRAKASGRVSERYESAFGRGAKFYSPSEETPDGPATLSKGEGRREVMNQGSKQRRLQELLDAGTINHGIIQAVGSDDPDELLACLRSWVPFEE